MSDNLITSKLQQADGEDAKARKIYERSDLDGVLSEMVSRLNAEKLRLEAQLMSDGGVSEFDALFDLNGNVVDAKIVNTKYGVRWMVFSNGTPTGEFLPLKPVRKDTLRKRGYTEGRVVRKATVVFSKGDLGSTRPIIVPVGNPTEVVEVLYADRFED
jgi:hypothetical protein